jgi:nucleotide-binding universal stress UspA family protein
MTSPLRSILLHVDAEPASVARLEIALELAEHHDARITALFAALNPVAEASFGYSAAAAHDDLSVQRRAQWRDLAVDRLRRAGGDDDSRVAWFDLTGDAFVSGFVAESAYADLLVLGAPSMSGASGGPPAGFVESVIVESGRPALVVPTAGPRRNGLGRRVLVAWDGSPQAARALGAALPLLRSAESVHVASWSHRSPQAPCSGLPIEGFLVRHGVVAQVHARGPSPRVGDELAALARTLEADLLVMGCYRHGRAREWILGGVTRSMLHAAAVPLLMAH